jgi:hypothetical protein
MVVGTLLGIFFVPLFFVVVQRLAGAGEAKGAEEGGRAASVAPP